MKKLLLIVLPLLLIVGCSDNSDSIQEYELIEQEGLKFHPETRELYNGKVHGQDRIGYKLKGFYKEGKKDSTWTEYYDDGKTRRNSGNFKDGEEVGFWTEWNESGQKISEGTYKGGGKDGFWTEWNESGQKISEGTYKNGKFDGLMTEWYHNGQKKSEENYKDRIFGEYSFIEVGKWTKWYENGQKKSEKTLKDGWAVGTSTEWYETGKKKSEITYKVDKRRVLSFYKSGERKSEENYVDNRKHGKNIDWYEDGNIFYTEYWWDQHDGLWYIENDKGERVYQKIYKADKKGSLRCAINDCDGFHDTRHNGKTLEKDKVLDAWGKGSFKDNSSTFPGKYDKERLGICYSCYGEKIPRGTNRTRIMNTGY